METSCVSCKKNTPNSNYSFRRTKQNRVVESYFKVKNDCFFNNI